MDCFIYETELLLDKKQHLDSYSYEKNAIKSNRAHHVACIVQGIVASTGRSD